MITGEDMIYASFIETISIISPGMTHKHTTEYSDTHTHPHMRTNMRA